jgi:hypothetical protein
MPETLLIWTHNYSPRVALIRINRPEEMRIRKFKVLNSKPWRKSSMVKKIAMAVLLALTFLPAASYAQVIVRIAPPVAIVEHPGPRPQPGFVWIAGYHRWDGAHYVWVGGRWDRPPHPGQRWVAHRWVHRGDHWEMVEGHWR